jgi:hypothetical protein
LWNLNGQGADIARLGIVDRIGVVLANRTEFSGHTATGPQQLDAMARTTFRAHAFGRFFTEADVLNTFDPFLGVGAFFFRLHFDFSAKVLNDWG